MVERMCADHMSFIYHAVQRLYAFHHSSVGIEPPGEIDSGQVKGGLDMTGLSQRV
jgi:hypothetical protein